MSITLASLALTILPTPYLVFLDFEDLAGFAPIPAGYGGVSDWGSWAHSDTPDPNYPPASGATRIFSVGQQAPIVFGEDVVFEGAHVVTAAPFAWKLYYQGQLVHTSAVLQPNTGGPAVYLASGYTGFVDSIEYDSPVNVHSVDDMMFIAGFSSGGNICVQENSMPNSSGSPSAINVVGSPVVADNDLTLVAYDLPQNQFGMFIVSMTQSIVSAPNSNGFLCLGGTIGRFAEPSQLGFSGANGEFRLQVDLTAIPQGSGFVAIAPGETWTFQAWHRDTVGGGSDFTGAYEVTFL